jgi:hypothetical protein
MSALADATVSEKLAMKPQSVSPLGSIRFKGESATY